MAKKRELPGVGLNFLLWLGPNLQKNSMGALFSCALTQ
jgi:hypothetical protein